jgi:putative membrane protein insertion efficiency factor
VSAVSRALLSALRFYQRAISPTRPPRCRFVPTCSAYAVEAVELHGAVRGTWLALRRLLKCAPWHPGGVDLVPEQAHSRRAGTARAPRSSKKTAPIPGAPMRAAPHPVPASTAGAPVGPGHPAGLRPGPAAGDLR